MPKDGLYSWGKCLGNIVAGVASTFYQLPCTIDKLFCDGIDMFGLLYWHERLIEIDKAMKKDIPEPKKR